MTPDWIRYFVRDLIDAHYSGPSPTCEERQVRSDVEWGLLKTTAITWENGWDWRQHKVLPRAFWGQTRLEVRPNDVLVTKAGPRHRVGVVAYVPQSPPHLMASGKMIGLRPTREVVVPAILAGVLSTAGPQRFLDHRTTGMAESQVNFANDTLLSTPVMLPPMSEQLGIRAILDSLDKAVRCTVQVIAKLQRMKKGLLKDLLTRGIDGNGEVRDPDRHPEQFKESPLGAVPTDWNAIALGEVTDPAAPICYGIVQSGAFVRGGPTVLSIGDLDGDFRTGLHRTAPAIDVSYSRSRVKPGDVLLSIKGTIGRVAVVPAWHEGNISRDLARIRLARSVSPAFVHQYLISPEGQGRLQLAVVGTTRAEISIHVLKRILIPVPPREEQEAIAHRLRGAEDRIGEEQAFLEKLQLLKRGLMEDLLTGRVRVTDLLAGDAA